MYVCQADNNVGKSEAEVELVVVGPPGTPVASVNIEEMTAIEGQTVTIECKAMGKPVFPENPPIVIPSLMYFFPPGSPTPVITWSKLRAPLPWKHAVADGVLTLTDVGRQDSGQYICNATNIHGYSEAYTDMEVDSE